MKIKMHSTIFAFMIHVYIFKNLKHMTINWSLTSDEVDEL